MTFFGNIGDMMITDRFFALSAAAVLIGLGFGAGPASGQVAAAQPSVAETRLSPAAAKMRDALARRLGNEPAAMAAYSARGYQPIWLDKDGRTTDAALILVDFLRHADEQALPDSKYGGDALAGRLGQPGNMTLEADLTAAFLAYADDIELGVLVPSEIDKDFDITVHHSDPGALVTGAASAANMAAYLDSLAPQSPLYRRLVERYRAFRSVAGGDIWGPTVGSGRTLRPGDRSPRVAQARARLTAMGDLDPNVYGRQAAGQTDGVLVATADTSSDLPAAGYDPEDFDQPLEDALKRFQARHGLNQDGLIGPATLAQLNVSARERADQIAVNLERQRWLNHQLDGRYILVNLAGFEMWVMDNGRPVFDSRVINGQANDWETPEFSETMTHIVINPTWYVPMSIARNEILPKLKRDPSYLARQGMRLVGTDREAEQIDWSTVTPSTFPGRVTQLPGDSNALGNVKFMFPNAHSVYLHDTPSKNLFGKDVRDFSHGCIRVEKPHELAEYLLSGQSRDPASYFDGLLADGREHRVDLERPLPVFLTYRTAWIDENGVEQFRGDIYSRDREVAQALKAAGVRILN